VTDILDAAGSVELAVVERSGMIESRHLGAAVVLSPDGSVLRELGDAGALVYPRSSLKPLQAVAVLRSGVDLDGERLVLSSASHAGTPRHVATVRSMLASAGLDERALHCPADWPLDRASRDDIVAAGGDRARVTMNCSGKHAAFLLSCVHNGWSLDDYLDPGHPLQQHARATVEEFSGEMVEHTGVDGCGAPVFAVTLRGLATAVGRVAGAEPGSDAGRLAAAIQADAWALDGPGRANTVVIERLGLLTKGGAEGVLVMAAPDGTAVALKMLDGSPRATGLVALALLASVGAVDSDRADEVAAEITERVLGGGAPVGELRVSSSVLAVSPSI
jgi:L-asparaginase II